jgi:hypothetical protein
MKFDQSVNKDVAGELITAMKNQSQNLGIVEGAAAVHRAGRDGFIVWHFVFHNEISFVAADGQVERLYTSIGDDYAVAEFERLCGEFSKV